MAIFTSASINELFSCVDIGQLWYAENAAASGSSVELRKWWDNINTMGRSYECSKNISFLKDDAYNLACKLFEGSGVNVVTVGFKVLECPIGVASSVESEAEAASNG